jgi:hypothetical protein
MASDNTRRAVAQHEVGHALLSLVASIALASIPVTQAIARVRALTTLAQDGDFAVLRKLIEDILRDPESQGVHMENVVRHCHELRRKLREHHHILAGSE